MKLPFAAKNVELTLHRTPHYIAKQRVNVSAQSVAGLLQNSPLSQTVLFLKEFCKEPRSIGAICPSSAHLARCMAKHIPHGDGLVVELGAGTGTVTRAVADALDCQPKRLWAVEQSQKLATLLSKKMPAVNVVQGDARELARILPQDCPVDVIISCLPLRSFSAENVQAITQQWHQVLAPHGFVVQFTYALWRGDTLRQYGFEEATKHFVWKNCPPARVQILKKIQ